MKRTNVYIDGYNLYYGLLKGTPNKWLDLSCLVRGLLAPDHEIGTIYYFTSIITPYPYDAAAIEKTRKVDLNTSSSPETRNLSPSSRQR